VDSAGSFILLRQSKYGIEGDSLAPVGGFMEDGEKPLEAVKRETVEELGYESRRWIPLGSYRADSNRGCGTGHMFLALHAEKTREPDADDLEKQEIVRAGRRDVEEELASGRIKVMPWAHNIALALLYLRRGEE
jgi:ADP-ribose pyrophosphatase